jgi:hypothetical protein
MKSVIEFYLRFGSRPWAKALLTNSSLGPNFGGEVTVVSLGCEKLQPERLLPPGSIPLIDLRNEATVDVVCLQDDAHVGFMSMVDGRCHPATSGADRNPDTPSNRKDGLLNIVEEVMDSIVKSGQRLHLRQPAIVRRHESACFHVRTWYTLGLGGSSAHQSGHSQRLDQALAWPDGHQHRQHFHRRKDH